MPGRNRRIEGAELTIYTNSGEEITIDLSNTELIVMLKSVGCSIDIQTHEVSFFGEKFLHRILSGEINPFRLMEDNQ